MPKFDVIAFSGDGRGEPTRIGEFDAEGVKVDFTRLEAWLPSKSGGQLIGLLGNGYMEKSFHLVAKASASEDKDLGLAECRIRKAGGPGNGVTVIFSKTFVP